MDVVQFLFIDMFKVIIETKTDVVYAQLADNSLLAQNLPKLRPEFSSTSFTGGWGVLFSCWGGGSNRGDKHDESIEKRKCVKILPFIHFMGEYHTSSASSLP